MGRGGLHVHDHAVLGVDQVVRRVGVERRAAWRRGPASLRIRQRKVLRLCLLRRLAIQGFQVLAHRTGAERRILPVDRLAARNAALPVRVGRHHARVHRKPLTLHQTSGHAAAHDFIEQPSESTARAEAAVAILGERRMLGHCVFQPQTAEPPVGEVQVHFLTQPSLRSDAKAVADDEHADRQLRIDRGATSVAIERRQMSAQIIQIENAVDAAKEVIDGNVAIEIEGVEQLIVRTCLLPHHLDVSLAVGLPMRLRASTMVQGSLSTE